MDYEQYLKTILSSEDVVKLLDEYKKEPISSLRINFLKYDCNFFKQLFPNLIQHNYLDEAFYYDKKTYSFGKYPLHKAGAYYIQDASAMMVSKLLEVKKGDKVLDLCAAPGGKSSQVASYLQQTGLLVCNDNSYKRALDLSENIERMGASNCIVLNEDTGKISNVFEGYFDKVILDAPCSGQGMFRKNNLCLVDWTYEKVSRLAIIQKQLILQAYRCLKKDGVLVYSTCTFTTEENEEVIKYLLNNSKASIVPIKMTKDFYPSINLDGAIRMYPFSFKGEGHFICLIKCNDDHKGNVNVFNKPASKKEIQIYKNFEKEFMNISLEGDYIKMGDQLHLLPEECFNLNGLKVLRNGLHLGTIKNNRFEPNHALALYLKKENVKNYCNCGNTSNEAFNYLKGLTLPSINKKGYVLMCVEGISLGWCKDDGRYLKNLYPKGLRICEG